MHIGTDAHLPHGTQTIQMKLLGCLIGSGGGSNVAGPRCTGERPLKSVQGTQLTAASRWQARPSNCYVVPLCVSSAACQWQCHTGDVVCTASQVRSHTTVMQIT